MDRMDARLFADYSELLEMDVKVLVDIILTTRAIAAKEMVETYGRLKNGGLKNENE
tara:strand:+ start:231 stop:398 length:168 start_codon:yes stop_codon:yes gene_type:complete